MRKVLVISHKGITAEGDRGNTLSDFKSAHAAGVDMIEMDVRRTKDNVFVTHYAEDISGTFLKNLNYATASDLAKKRSYELPKLSSVIAALPRAKFEFELKEQGYELEFLAFLKKHIPNKSRFILSSYHDRTITIIKHADPEIKAGLRLWQKNPKDFIETRVSEIFPFKRIEQCGADFFSINWVLLPLGLLWRAKKRGIPVHVACIDPDTNLTPFLKNSGLAAVLTDRPVELREILDKLSQ